jgi:hypothetical protein
VCTFAVSCGLDMMLSQCQINCEMGSAVGCNTPATMSCVQGAVADRSCTALSACHFEAF